MLKEEQTVGDHHQSPHIRQFEPNPKRAISHSAFRTKFKHSGLSRSFRSILVTFGSIPVIQVHPGPYIRVHPGHSDPSWSHLGLSRSFRSTLITFRSNLVSFSSFRSFRSFRSKFRSLRSIMVHAFGSVSFIQVYPGACIRVRLVHSGLSWFMHSGPSRSFRSILVHAFGFIPVIQVYPDSCIRVCPGHVQVYPDS
ncbi:hypothetical protein CDL15_Pgr010710 [Punica granatum]|uniref:Uncharacterized protein n=1 Tax=Punica granatum TaxID=22663 RepID=A0A218WN66_PUNGR|nr:hypothetical protein CDL15_Pgr010710 [Punica granatum]